MKLWRYALLALLATSSLCGQTDELPPLPEWENDDLLRWERGEELISDMLFQSLQEAEPVAPMIEGFSWQQYEREMAEEKKVRDIPEEILEEYFAKKPSNFLIDPQSILTRQEYRDRLSFLKYHDSDSQVGLYVYLFEGQQELAAKIRAEQLIRQHFADAGPTALVMYYMGEPGRAELHLSDELLRSVGASERARALQSAINQARVKSQSVDQLDSFCVQMSIRLYWMEKAWQAGVIAPIESASEDAVVAPKFDGKQKLHAWWQRWGIPLMVASGVIGVSACLRWVQLRRRRYHFPATAITPQLGRPHAAMTSDVMSFSSHQKIVSSSKDQ